MQSLGSPFDETLDTATAYTKIVSIIATRGPVTETLNPAGGQITCDARRSLRWNGQLEIPVTSDLVPTVPSDLLAPFGTEIAVTLGVLMGDGSQSTIPFGTMIVDAANVALSPTSRSVSLPLMDLAQKVASYRFETPLGVAGGVDMATVINTVILDRLGVDPGLPTTGIILTRPRVFGLDPQTDPWRELVDLANGFGYRLYYDRNAALTLDQPPAADAADAVAFSGQLTAAGAFDRRPANVIVVRGETSGDTPPVQAVVYDDDPTSPTYAGPTPGTSPYGRVTRYYASPLLTNIGQCQLAASNILASEAAAAATWTVTKAYEPRVDPDDILNVPLDEDTTLPLIVDSVTVDISGTTTMQCRALSTLSETTGGSPGSP